MNQEQRYPTAGNLEAPRLVKSEFPGGMYRCRADEGWQILEVNSDFLQMFGYTCEEIRHTFQNSYHRMIDQRDRDIVEKEITYCRELESDCEIEYRVPRADGQIIWVREQGRLIRELDGQVHYCCTLMDITNSKRIQEELRLSLERYQIIIDQTDDIILEWDMVQDTFSYSPNWSKKFQYVPISREVSSRLACDSHILSDDTAYFMDALRALRKGSPYIEVEFRLQALEGSYLWCRARFTTQYDETGRPIKAVGVIIDIDDEKRQAQKLMEIAQRDPLTGLYNKGASQKLIEERLKMCAQQQANCALLIIDIDNFKYVNDAMGHLFGDAFLVEAARAIESQFRRTDIVGRIGGDEFLVYMCHINNKEIVDKKAAQVIDAIRHIQIDGTGIELVSCSIGSARFPDDGKTYKELYHQADLALYQAKNAGKNCHVAFNSEEQKHHFPGMTSQIRTFVSAKIDSDDENRTMRELAEYVFHILYQATDTEAAVNTILEIVGRRFDVSRAYIFENTEDSLYCCNTFEWCNEGVTPEIENLRQIAYADLGTDYLENFNEDGIFYCRDIATLVPEQYEILKTQGIKSLLQSAIYNDGAFYGYVGFDDCRSNRFWDKEQINALVFISEILSIFLLKWRAQERVERSALLLQTILDNQNSWIYVIDPETYEMRYINRRTRDLVPDARLGMRCFAAYFHREQPCENCPMRMLTEERDNYTEEVYNPILHLWTLADATYIPWEGSRAVLLSCHDVSQYKIKKDES